MGKLYAIRVNDELFPRLYETEDEAKGGVNLAFKWAADASWSSPEWTGRQKRKGTMTAKIVTLREGGTNG